MQPTPARSPRHWRRSERVACRQLLTGLGFSPRDPSSIARAQRQMDVDSPLPPATTACGKPGNPRCEPQEEDGTSPALPSNITAVGADGSKAKQAAVSGPRGKARNPSARAVSGKVQSPAVGAPLVTLCVCVRAHACLCVCVCSNVYACRRVLCWRACATHARAPARTHAHTHTRPHIECRHWTRRGFRQCVLLRTGGA